MDARRPFACQPPRPSRAGAAPMGPIAGPVFGSILRPVTAPAGGLSRRLLLALGAGAIAALTLACASAQAEPRRSRIESTWVDRTWSDPTRPRPQRAGAHGRKNVHVHIHQAPARRGLSPAHETALVNAALLRQSVALTRGQRAQACPGAVSGQSADCRSGGARILGVDPAGGMRER